ncbi:MAG TPA: EpsG family protein [Bacillales bacterium]|nr:EpsG family protein [Bacillales bacterium]
MTVLWIHLVFVYVCSFLSRYFSVPELKNINYIKPNRWMTFLVILSFVIVSGLRRNIGDTYFYKHIYESNEFTWDYIFAHGDIGFGILQKILKLFTDDSQVLIFITALITNVLIIVILYKYSRLPELSMYVFITSGMQIVSMNGIRQFLAASILFTAIKYLIEGNWIKYSLIVLFASFFHQSAIIMIPVYFIVRRKAWTGATLMMLLLSVFFTFGFDKFSQILFGAMGDSHYSVYQGSTEGGANILRVAVYAAPVILAYIGRERLREIFPQGDFIVNMSLLAVVFMIISTQNWIFARFTIYFGLYQLILISWIPKLFTEKFQRLVYYAIIICYFIYFYYDSVITLNIQYRSNFF